MKTLSLVLSLGWFAVVSHAGAQTKPAAGAIPLVINLKDGKTVAASAVRCPDGKVVMATVPMTPPPGSTAPAQSGATVELGYPVGNIARIEFPEPPQLKAATDLLAQGKAAEAQTQLQPIVTYYAPFKTVPGAWWTQAALLKLSALVNLGRDADAEALISELSQASKDPEATLTARVQLAANSVRKGNVDKAAPVLDEAIKESKNPDTLAVAWLNKGHVLAAMKQWDPALLAYMRLPVFYPEQRLLMPQAMLGSARAFVGMEDLPNAEKAFNQVIAEFPASPEAAAAKTELSKAKATLASGKSA